MLDQVIDTILQIDNLNTSLLESKSAWGIFSDLRNNISKTQKQDWDSVEIPKFQDSINTDKFETAVLKHIRNLKLGEFNNVFEAKRRLVGGPILLANFDKHHLLTVLRNFEHESEENMLLLPITLKKFNVYSTWIWLTWNTCHNFHKTVKPSTSTWTTNLQE
jgi:hypothetical protein